MNDTQVKCFLEAAKCLNFSVAAERLFFTQPTLSRNIAALEKEIGTELFIRKNNVLEITPAGALLYAELGKMESRFRALLREIDSVEKTPVITIGHVESHFVTNRIIDKMRAFRLKRGELKYNLVRGSAQELKTMLDNEDIDVAYFMEKSAEKQSEYKYVILDRVQMKIVYAHNKYDFKEPIRFREFAKYPFLSVRKEASDMSKYIRETCNICGFEPIIIEAADIEERTQQLENGMGVALLPSNHREVYNKLLTSVIPSDLPCEHIVAIVAKNKAQGLLNDFIEAMKME